MSDSSPFIVLGLPRSRTYWLSKFLSYGGWYCGHDEARYIRNLDDVKSWFSQSRVGSVETAVAPFWRLIPNNVRVAVVRRPINQAVESWMRVRSDSDRSEITREFVRLDRKLDQIEKRVPEVLSVTFDDLDTEEGCSRIFRHCINFEMPSEWWKAWKNINLQIDVNSLTRYVDAYKPQLTKIADVCRYKILSGLSRSHQSVPEHLTIQVERFDDFYRDSKSLFEDHCYQIGESPGNYKKKNAELARKLDRAGYLQCVTARSNGRVFGYLMTVIAPSLESETLISAFHTTFFASPEFPGLGLRLQRASADFLRKRGVGEIVMREGIRGSGDRASVLYRRLGATEYGHLYHLNLEH